MKGDKCAFKCIADLARKKLKSLGPTTTERNEKQVTRLCRVTSGRREGERVTVSII